ncbi:unnamed protein product [Porites lobata]|uniref:Tyr recombinase domain-containing protein n=1 Tax=Porites lobata TaxID=104759 RepID=A0ABN8NRB4_9CNID|nr:unnamed protein product [Porites lobata]
MADNAHISQDFISSVIAGEAFADASLLAFRDSSSFRAGELHRHIDQWNKLFQSSDNNFSEVLDWIHNFIHVDKFFTHYKGSYKGVNYNCDRPPARIFANHPSCKAFAQFITDTLIERLASGAISLWGKVGECPPPHLVMPLTVEPTKPRLSSPLLGFYFRSEKHCHFRLFSDSSSFALGGVLSPGAITVSTSDYWDSSVIGAAIATKETLALNNALQSFGNTDLPQVQRFFIPAVACPSCAYANDHLFRFCQMCGYKRKSVPRQPASKIKVDLAAIDARLQQLTQTANTLSYSKQKSSLRVEFETFLASLPNTKSIYSATPEDVSRFLIWKDRHGKRVVHVAECVNAPNQDASDCGCPKRLAFKTVDSYIGKLHAIFNEAGRSGEWNSMLGFGNPAASSPVQGYLKAVSEEQLRAHIVPKQAVPFFLPKLLLLARLWDRKMADPAVSPSALFILARDQAFFKTLFFSADRGSDLGCVKTAEIMRFAKDDGFLFNHVWGKTLRDGAYNVFGIRRHSNPQLCQVKAIETYVAVASELRITLSNGYLFRPTNHQGHIVNKPLTSSSAEARLKYYLKDAKIDEGETLHGFRSGSAITLALSGSQLADVMSHVGWSNKSTALYYMKLAEVLREGSPSDLLTSNELAASASTTLYADLNRLKDFVSTFPRS